MLPLVYTFALNML